MSLSSENRKKKKNVNKRKMSLSWEDIAGIVAKQSCYYKKTMSVPYHDKTISLTLEEKCIIMRK